MHDADATRSPDLESRLRELGPWFQNFTFDGIATAPDHFLGDYPRIKWDRFKHVIPEDLAGASVLDIGCNAGFYSIQMKLRGADRVLGVDFDARYLQQARVAAELSGVDIEFRETSVYEVATLGERFDLVLFMGVLYHLRHPLLALDLIREHVARDLVIVQSMLRGSRALASFDGDYPFSEEQVFDNPDFPLMYFVERKYAADPTNWWIPNASGLAAMLRSAGFEILERPEEEVFVCRPAAREPV